MNEPYDLVIYHANCQDGFASAWVAHKHSPDAVFVAAQYGDEPPSVEGKRVLICDFSYPRGVIEQMHAATKSLLVLDHHASAAQALAGLDYAVFDMERSGAGLTWDTLFPDAERPWLVTFVEDRDLWRFRYGRKTREIHAVLMTYPFDFDVWDALVERHDTLLLHVEGRAVLRFIEQTAEKFAARARVIELDGVSMWAVNVPPEWVSDTAQVLKEREPHLPVLCWSWDGARGDIYCSLRSRDDGPDVSVIAQRYGGGGHVHAAGFRRPTTSAVMSELTASGWWSPAVRKARDVLDQIKRLEAELAEWERA